VFRDEAVTLNGSDLRIATLSLLPAGLYAVSAKTLAGGAGATITCQLGSSSGDFDVAASVSPGATTEPMQLAVGLGSNGAVWVNCHVSGGNGFVQYTKITAIRLSSLSNTGVHG
jgi:hypothetical protein